MKNIYFTKKHFFIFFAIALIFLFLSEPAFAGNTSLPWEGPLETLKKSLTGPVALAIALIGVVVAGGMLIFGGELGEFARRIIMLVLVLSLLILSSPILSTLFGVTSGSGAII